MKRLTVLIAVLFIALVSVFPVKADTYDDFLNDNNASQALDKLPESAKKSLKDIGIDSFSYKDLENLDLNKIISSILNIAGSQGETPLKAFAAVIAVMLLYSMLYGVKNSAEGSLQPVISVSVTLCITCILVLPLMDFITNTVDVIKISSDFMTAYVPLMVLAISMSGQPVSAAGYYGLMMFMGQGVSRVSSEIISPFMKIFLALGVSSSISPNINLNGIVQFISKFTRILLVFCMSIFTGVLSFKQVISMGADSVSSRAVRLSLSSFVPIVGSALSEAYRTVQGSIGLLKSGIGIISIIALAAVYLPIIIKCLFWMLTLGFAKAVGEVLNLREPCTLLMSVYSVISTLFAVILCMIMLFIISTSIVIMLGGGG